jgi:RNA polymerase sigma-70 factor (ECF subfamily)
VLVRKLPTFHHNGRTGAFRAWLRTVTLHELAEFRRRRAALPALRNNDELDALLSPLDELARAWEAEYERRVLSGLLSLVEPEFTAATWRIFRRVSLEGTAIRVVAAEMGLTVNAVTVARSRVLRRLRQEARGLLD